MLAFLHTILYVPIYNLLIFLASVVPHGDLGLALVGVVLLVRLILLPLSLSTVHTQRAMQLLQPEIKILNEKYKNDKEKLAKETFALYKKYDLHPFASILTLFIQLPILFTLYFIVRGKSLYQVDTSLLYPFVHAPAVLSPLFLGIFLISSPNIILAVLAALSQFLYGYFGIPLPTPATPTTGKASSPGTMTEEFGRAMTMQMRYVLPVVIGIVSYTSGVIALYFIVSNIVMLFQTVLAKFTTRALSSRIGITESKTS
jgi:YidC/Oxa1 family membrane protein insertase